MVLCFFSVSEQLTIKNISLKRFFFCFYIGASPECFQKSKYFTSELIFGGFLSGSGSPIFYISLVCSSCFITPKHTTLWELYSTRWAEEAHEALMLPFLGGHDHLRDLLDPVWKIWQHLVVRAQRARSCSFYVIQYKSNIKSIRTGETRAVSGFLLDLGWRVFRPEHAKV